MRGGLRMAEITMMDYINEEEEALEKILDQWNFDSVINLLNKKNSTCFNLSYWVFIECSFCFKILY